MKYLELYYKWMESGKLPIDGLCRCFPKNELFRLMIPVSPMYVLYCGYMGDIITIEYWEGDRYKDFSPLRQNIILFLAAMNNEL